MYFLDYGRAHDWVQIMDDSVRSTEGVTQRARLCVQALGADAASDRENVKTFEVRAQIEPTYFEGQLFVQYDTGRQIFKQLPVFMKGAHVISKVILLFQEVRSSSKDDGTFRVFANALEQQMSRTPLLLERSFSIPPEGSTFQVTSRDVLDPLFTTPNTGKTVPLWFVGGILSDAEPLPNEAGFGEKGHVLQAGTPTLGVEPLFAFPNIDPKGPSKASVELWRTSTLIAKDPRFKENRSSLFTWFPREVQPWNLGDILESGAIVLDLSEGRFASKQLLKGTKGGEVWITFERIQEDEDV